MKNIQTNPNDALFSVSLPEDNLTENLTDSQLNLLNDRLMAITDNNQSDTVNQMSDEDREMAETYVKLSALIQDSIQLKSVEWKQPETSSIPPVIASGRHKSVFKRLVLTTAAAVCALICGVAVFQLQNIPNSPVLSPVAQITDKTDTSSDDSDGNYWDNNFEDQLSAFEGEMICMSSTEGDFNSAISNVYYSLEDISQPGDF